MLLAGTNIAILVPAISITLGNDAVLSSPLGDLLE